MRLLNVDLSSAVEPGSTIITPSPLLASAASEQIVKGNLQAGQNAWQRPEILSINAWLTNCWRAVRYNRTDTPTLLSPSQEQAVWQRLIGQEHPNLGHQAGTARLAIDAARLIAEWRMPLKHESWADYKDAQQFRALFKQFRGLCKARNWITVSDLWRLVPKWMAANRINPGKVVFAGFESFTPAVDGIRKALGERGKVAPVNSPERNPFALAKACASFAEEVEYAARWARQLIEEKPNRSVGIFVPDLRGQYALIERTFKQVLHPSRGLPPRESTLFHMDGSKPLSSHPLIVNAVLLLELARPRIALADASAILRCPFIKGAASEANTRALADM